jgi:hypothetical protein
LDIERGPCEAKHEDNSTKHGRYRQNDGDGQSHRLKICRQEQKNNPDRQQETHAKAGDGILQRRNLATE